MKSEIQLLDEKIISLERIRAHELKRLKEHLHCVHEELKPINLIKSTFKEVTTSPEIKNNFITNAVSLGAGYLVKKALVNSSHNPIKNTLGALLQFAVANVVAKRSDTLKAIGENLVGLVKKQIGHKKAD